MKEKKMTRRQFLATTAIATAAMSVGPWVKTSHSAGKLSIFLWDHWIPGANDVSRKMIMDWGKANGVNVTVDYVTSRGDKNLITIAAESRAKTGHDIMDLPTLYTALYKDDLEPMDDVVGQIISAYGPVTPDAEYSGKVDGTWYSAPGPIGTHLYPMVSRLDLWKEHAGIDLKKIFPAGPDRDPALVKSWNYDNFLEGCKKLHAAGFPFGGPLGSQTDAQDWTGALFASFGSYPVDKDGNITFDSDGTRAALEYMKELCEYMPKEIYAWDDASNNTWIISGRGSAIQNPPSAWRVAVRDQIQTASKLWHHDTPAGPKGRFRGSLTRMNGVWKFSKNKSAAKDLLLHLLQKEQQNILIDAAIGYDIPLIASFNTHPVWKYTGPPDGTLYNYPVQGDEYRMICGYPAPATISAAIYDQDLFPNTVAKVTQEGKSIDDAIKWAINELEGFMRA
jgi:hypothetical protein